MLWDSCAGGYIDVTNGTCNRSFFCLPGYVSSNNASVYHDKLDNSENIVPGQSFSSGVDLVDSENLTKCLRYFWLKCTSLVKVQRLVRFWRVRRVTRVLWMWPATRGRFPSWRQPALSATRSALLEW